MQIKNYITWKPSILVMFNPETTEPVGYKEFTHVTMEAKKTHNVP